MFAYRDLQRTEKNGVFQSWVCGTEAYGQITYMLGDRVDGLIVHCDGHLTTALLTGSCSSTNKDNEKYLI